MKANRLSDPRLMMSVMLQGRVIAESLRVGCDLQIRSLRITRINRQDVSAAIGSHQPDVWTLLDVEGPDDTADDLASALADALVDGQGWYADFRVADDHFVIFPGRIFRYAIGDHAGRAETVRYGRLAGVPPHQLDWGD